MEFACDGSSSRTRRRLFNEPVTVNLIPGLPGVSQGPEILPSMSRQLVHYVGILIEQVESKGTPFVTERT